MKNPAFPLPLLLLFLVVSQSLLPLSFSNPIHEVLVSNGLPAGLLPKDVKSFSLSESGVLEVFLERPCLTKFDNRVFYEAVVKANLTYGALTNVSGLSQEELFLWLPVKDIIVDDPSSGLIVFDIGVAHKELSLSLFEFPRDCKPGVESGWWVCCYFQSSRFVGFFFILSRT